MIDTALTHDDPPIELFRRWMLDDHPSLGWKLPGIRIHNKSEVLEDFPELSYRKLSEFWFNDDNARMALLATPEGRVTAEDAATHNTTRVQVQTEETIIIE